MRLLSLLVGSLPVLSAPFGNTGEADFMEAMQVQPDIMIHMDQTVDEPSGKVITFGVANMF